MDTRETMNTSQYNVTIRTTSRPDSRTYPLILMRMFREAILACKEILRHTPPIETDGPYCNRTIDGMAGCWPDTLPGTYAKIQCPDIPIFNKNAFAYKECTINGTWYEEPATGAQSANYSQCRMGPNTYQDETRHIYIFIGGFSLSIAMLLVSLLIFFRFRQLQCDRITIHKNLFISYVLTGISWILYYVLVALDGHIILQNPVWCQILHVVCQYFTVCNFMWMFCEGLYLNTRMVYAFATGKILLAWCYLCGWGFPLLLSVAYASARGNDISNTHCWINDSNLQWIMNGPVILSLVINILFLINIVRLLITKLREMPEVAQTRKAARAILILIPLLGLQYLLFPVRPEEHSELEDLYHITVALVVSLQGAFVSVIYCFCNGEVIALLRRKYRQHRLMTTRSLQRSSSGHGTTTYTIVDNVGDIAKQNPENKLSHTQQTIFSSEVDERKPEHICGDHL